MTKIKCEAGQLKKFIQAVRILNTESRLHFNADGISLRVVDVANVAMLSLSLKGIAMKGYSFNEKTPAIVGMDWPTLSKVLQATKAQTPLNLEFKDKGVSFSYDEIDGKIMYLDNNTIRKDPNPPQILTLGTSFEFDGSLINKLGKTLFGDKLELTMKDKIVECRCDKNGDDQGHTRIQLSRHGNGKDARSLYSWDYWISFGKVLDKAYVTAFFADDHPIRLCSTIQGIDIEYLLAPRIEVD